MFDLPLLFAQSQVYVVSAHCREEGCIRKYIPWAPKTERFTEGCEIPVPREYSVKINVYFPDNDER